MFKIRIQNIFTALRQAIKPSLIAIPAGAAIGSVVAFFLWLLNLAIQYRFHHPWLLYLLPIAGVIIHLLYKWYGDSAERGNNLIIDAIHLPGAGVPRRLAPLILFTTVITHLFGGSAGREGTAVQIGGALAHWVTRWFKLTAAENQIVLTAGIAAGFGAVFGTPFTGAIFAIEVLIIGKLRWEALLPCLIAGLLGSAAVDWWGVQHTVYRIGNITGIHLFYGHRFYFDLTVLLKTLIAAPVFGAVSYLFVKAAHGLKKLLVKLIKIDWLIPVAGGLIIIGLTFLIGKPDYLSLGVQPEYPGAVTIVSAFEHGGAQLFSWLWKLIFTIITLSSGFKGGEVTPLFYIGATLGNSLAVLIHAPVGLFAALGFIAVFAGATKTPLACSIMGFELFGGAFILFYLIACFIALLCSGRIGIYTSQRRP